VPSRRLGLSLGLNIIPFKTCTCDCSYCQCGRTTCQTLKRRSFFPVAAIIEQVRQAVSGKQIDFLTFSGGGEPTLNRDLGTIIRRLKRLFAIPVAVLTNATLLNDPQVRRDLSSADLVKASLDAADQRTFVRIDRCHPKLRVEDVILGLKRFRRTYPGQLWLEIMLVKGINDAPEQLTRLRRVVYEIGPDRVHLNTVVRPPAEKWAQPLSYDDLIQVQMLFGPGTEIATPGPVRQRRFKGQPDRAIRDFVAGRPATADDLCRSLGISLSHLKPALRRLIRARQIKPVTFYGKTFYEPFDPSTPSSRPRLR